MKKTAVVWDQIFTLHDMGPSHAESPERLFSIKTVLDGDGVGREAEHLKARAATQDELGLIHDENYIKRIEATAGKDPVFLDPDTSTNAHTWDAACNASGALIRCVEDVCDGRIANAFAFVRPPGHHAERNRAMGFCIFNHVAIAAEWLVKKRGLERVAIIDFDVHHCNGTQHAFYDRPDVFVASIHHFPFYPGTGAALEIGEGDGRGTTLNIPLRAGSGDDDYMRAFEERIIPGVLSFGAQFILVSAGYDAHRDDPLGGMRVSTAGFRSIMELITQLAKECSDGKMAAALEGGYNIRALRASVEAQLEVMVQAG